MKTIQKIRIADCDRSTDDNGKFTSSAWEYMVQDDDGNDLGHFDTEEEAEKAAGEVD